MNPVTDDEKIIFLSYLINLKRRPDRILKFFRNNKNELLPLNIFEAVDGKKLEKDHKIQKTFSTGDYNYRSGIVGCASSHIELWKIFLKEYKNDFMLVLEDDAKLLPNFKEKLLFILNNYNNDFDILFLHFHPYQQHINKLKPKIFNQQTPFIEQWNKETCCNLSMGGTTGYIITKTGALNMLNHIKKYGMYNAVDWVMHKTADEQRICYSFPCLVTADCYTGQNTVDTDIQNDFSSLKMSDQEWDTYEINTLIKYFNEYNIKVELYSEEKIISCKTYLPGDPHSLNNLTNEKTSFVYTDIANYIDIDDYLLNLYKQFNKLVIDKNNKKDLYIYFNKIDLYNISIITLSQFEKEKNKIKNFPVHYYKTNKIVYIINDKYISEQIYQDKIFGDDLLN